MRWYSKSIVPTDELLFQQTIEYISYYSEYLSYFFPTISVVLHFVYQEFSNRSNHPQPLIRIQRLIPDTQSNYQSHVLEKYGGEGERKEAKWRAVQVFRELF